MARDDWYRRSTWTEDDQADFEKRLKRARKANRDQYLRIQAVHLTEVGQHHAALELLKRLTTEFPDSIFLSWAYELEASSRKAIGDISGAIRAYESALEAEQKRPNVRSTAWLQLPTLIVEEEITDRYEQAVDILRQYDDDRAKTFPNEAYRFHAILAIICQAWGDTDAATNHAKKALDRAQAKHSGFSRHPDMGLVDIDKDSLIQRVARIHSERDS